MTKTSQRTFGVASQERVSASRFLDILDSKKENILNTTFVPPKVGGNGFGEFVVNYKHPELLENV